MILPLFPLNPFGGDRWRKNNQARRRNQKQSTYLDSKVMYEINSDQPIEYF